MSILFDFNSGASLSSLGWTNISSSVSNTAAAGPDGSYAMKANNTIAGGGGSAAYAVNLTKRRIRVTAKWNRLWFTHSSGASLMEFSDFSGGAPGAAFNGNLVAAIIELGWSNYPTTPATSTTFTIPAVTANRTDASFQVATHEVFPASGTNDLIQSGFPGISSGFHDLEVVLTLSSRSTSGGSSSADGSIVVSLDGSPIYSISGIPIANPQAAGLSAYTVRNLKFAPMGVLDDIEISEEDVGSTPAMPRGDQAGCCASPGAEGSGISGPGAGVDPVALTVPEWTPVIAGGARGNELDDLTDAEDWSDS